MPTTATGGWRPTAHRPTAPRPVDVGVRFTKTRPSIWNGNGFGTSGAEWVALIGDVEVGRFAAPWSDVFGQRVFGIYTATSWRQAVAREAAKGL